MVLNILCVTYFVTRFTAHDLRKCDMRHVVCGISLPCEFLNRIFGGKSCKSCDFHVMNKNISIVAKFIFHLSNIL